MHASRQDVSVLCIYCNHKESDAQTIDGLLSSLMRQLIDQYRPAPSWIRDYHKSHTEEKKARTLDTLITSLTTYLMTPSSKVFILVDALEECDPVVRRRLLDFIQ